MSEARTIQAVLFDLDGTIVDTEPAAALAVVECFKQWGIDADLGDARYVTGRTWEVALDFFFEKYRIPVSKGEAGHAMLERYRTAMRLGITPIVGAVDSIRALAESYRLCVVSGSHRSEIEFALAHLGVGDCFEFILGAEDYPNSKPAPDGYQKALERFGFAPEQGLVFEDSHPGIESARTAGIRVVAVAQANHFGHDTGKAHDHIADLRGVDAAWVRAFEKRCPA